MAATTTPDGIIYPTLSDQGDDIPSVLSTMAGSIQTALTGLRATILETGNRRVGTAAQRGALTAGQLKDGLEFYETDTRKTYIRHGSTWHLEGEQAGTPTLASLWAVRPETGLRLFRRGPYVEMWGSVRNATGGNYDNREYPLVVAGGLPAGFRPAVQQRSSLVANANTGNMVILPDGAINLRLGLPALENFAVGAMWVFVDGARWRTD